MARGWESKSVESQIEAAEERDRLATTLRLSNEQIAHERTCESLELSRKRVLADIEAANNPKYREVLEKSLAFLDAKLAELKR